jgi:hypothetical protein
MISANRLREALAHGRKNGFTLFPEIRDRQNMNKLKNNIYTDNLLKELYRSAEEISREELIPITFKMIKEFETTGSRVAYDGTYSNKLNELAVLTLYTVIEDSDKYIEVLQERLWDLCNLYIWALTAHISFNFEEIKKKKIHPENYIDLLVAETGFQLSETISLIGHKLDPFLLERIKNEISRRVIEPYKSNLYWWENSTANWASVCAGSVGCTALYLIEDDDKLCIVLQKVLAALHSYLEGFDENGVTTEGFGYWNYGFASFLFFSELLRDRTSGRISLINMNEKMRKIVEFPSKILLSNGRTVNFSDCPEGGRIEYGMASRLEKLLNIKGLRSEKKILENLKPKVEERLAYLNRSMFWSLDKQPEDTVEAETELFYSSDAQWVVHKHITPEGKLAAFAAKGDIMKNIITTTI